MENAQRPYRQTNQKLKRHSSKDESDFHDTRSNLNQQESKQTYGTQEQSFQLKKS